MSHSNVTQAMSHSDVNSEGKQYHEHGDNKAEKEGHPRTHPLKQDPEPVVDEDAVVAPHHGHNNQYRKDIKGSTGSSSTEPGDHKK